MALYEDAGVPARPLFELKSVQTLSAIVRRSSAWVGEAAGLARGLAKLAAPFKWHFAVIFGFNTAIALWETVQPFILAWGVDTFGEKAPYLEIVAIIVFPGAGHRRAARHPAASLPRHLRRLVRQAALREARRSPLPCAGSLARTIAGARSSSAGRRRSRRRGATPPTSSSTCCSAIPPLRSAALIVMAVLFFKSPRCSPFFASASSPISG